MPLTLGQNLVSLIAAKGLRKSSDALSNSYEKLSSGMRINKASDDSASLMLATSLASQARLYGQGLRNINDGISLLNVAESATQHLVSITTRISELAEQGANGSYTTSQRQGLDAEAQALYSEFNRIVDTTKFNGISLLDSAQTFRIETGAISSQSSIAFTLGLQFATTLPGSEAEGNGTFTSSSFTVNSGAIMLAVVSDVNNDGYDDLVTATNSSADNGQIAVRLGNGDGSFKAPISNTFSGAAISFNNLATVDFNNDGKLDVVVTDTSTNKVDVLMGNGDGTFKFAISSTNSSLTRATTGDYDGDGFLDLVTYSKDVSTYVMISKGNGDGTFAAPTSWTTNGTGLVTFADLNGDNRADLIRHGGSNSSTIRVHMGNGDLTFKAPITYFEAGQYGNSGLLTDINNDGKADYVSNDYNGVGWRVSIALGNGDGSFKSGTFVGGDMTSGTTLQAGDFNGDGIKDIVAQNPADTYAYVYLSNSDGTYLAPVSYANANSQLLVGDINNDSVDDLITYRAGFSNAIGVFVTNTTSSSSSSSSTTPYLPSFSLLTISDSQSALTLMGTVRDTLEQSLGSIGASQSRLMVAGELVTAIKSVTEEAYAKITDVDIAEETAKMVSLQILQNVQTALFAQAKINAQIVLSLLN